MKWNEKGGKERLGRRNLIVQAPERANKGRKVCACACAWSRKRSQGTEADDRVEARRAGPKVSKREALFERIYAGNSLYGSISPLRAVVQ